MEFSTEKYQPGESQSQKRNSGTALRHAISRTRENYGRS
jgi:hypothetical protein